MGIFESIRHAIFDHAGAAHPQTTAAEPTSGQPPQAPAATPQAAAATPGAPPAPAAPPVDVEAILTAKAQAYGRPNNWRTSIVDLLALLGMDSSLAARKALADELDVHAGADGSAEENVALHKAVMQALAANGGKVPADLLG